MTSRTSASRTALVPAGILEQAARRVMLGAARRIRVGQLTVVLPDGSRRLYGDPASPHAGEIRVHDAAAAVRMLLGGEIGAGEAYMDGLWSSPDLPALLRVAALNREALALPKGWWRLPLRLQKTVAHRLRRNTVTGSRRNIEAHYDLGNDFYRLFLDETLTYSSAVFASPDQSLADAQRNKYRVMAERAGLRGGEHVLEIGSGWG
ncbi:MAG TPA: class I SAM-dependent methyltransferase, partial [Candidatus Limnocylindrales bacterium]